MADTLTYKAGDLEPSFIATVKSADGTVPDLTNATAVALKAKLTTGATTITRAGTFEDRVNGKVKFTWQSGDLATVGIYDMEIEVTWPTSRPSTHPNDTYVPLVVVRKAQG